MFNIQRKMSFIKQDRHDKARSNFDMIKQDRKNKFDLGTTYYYSIHIEYMRVGSNIGQFDER